jgi:hypothetical protein
MLLKLLSFCPWIFGEIVNPLCPDPVYMVALNFFKQASL